MQEIIRILRLYIFSIILQNLPVVYNYITGRFIFCKADYGIAKHSDKSAEEK